MPAAHLASSLAMLRLEVNKTWPNRSKASDGWIGDAAHASRRSDHNPNERGSVNALDITNDGIDVDRVINAAIRHPATAYVISRGFIYSRRYGWAKKRYTGANPHNTHIHVSIQQTPEAEADLTPWLRKIRTPFPLPAGHSYGAKASAVVHDGTRSLADKQAVQAIQTRLGIKPTGTFGTYTMVKVANWQVWKGLKPTGRVGSATWRLLGL